MVLKDWFFVRSGKYTAISGVTTAETKKFPNGKRIITSRIVKMDFNSMVVQTRNSIYELEKERQHRVLEYTFANSQTFDNGE